MNMLCMNLTSNVLFVKTKTQKKNKKQCLQEMLIRDLQKNVSSVLKPHAVCMLDCFPPLVAECRA